MTEGDLCGPGPSLQPPGSMPDTLAWDEYIQSSRPSVHAPSSAQQAVPAVLPQIPSQLLMPSQTTSLTSSAQAKYRRPFAGKGLDTLGGAKPKGHMAPSSLKQCPPAESDLPNGPSQELVRTDGSFVFVGHGEQGAETQPEPRAVRSYRQGISREAIRNLSDTVGGHEQRLDRLETLSFSADGHEECLEKHDHMDLRVTDLEQRMEGVEKVAEMATCASNQADGEDDGVKSVASTAASVASRLNSDEVMSQITTLHARFTHLESLLPSAAHAWVVEVVFLPFPLRRLWQDLSQFSNGDVAVSHDDWTQVPATLSSATRRSQSPFGGGGGEWAAADQDDWLHPRACGDKSTQDKRLRSRGLVRTVSFRGPDARSVQSAIHEAFGTVFRAMGMTTRRSSHATDDGFIQYLGLQEAWVPLRKIRKDSRLRFLSAAEMLTPAAWDVGLLHSAAMKAAQPRLFITHPDAYVQGRAAYQSAWDWQRVRDMDRVPLDATESQEVGEPDAAEHCWLWNEQLDTALARPSPRLLLARSVVPRNHDAESPAPRPAAGRRAPKPPHIRTASVPAAAAAARRIVSHHGRSSSSRPSSPLARAQPPHSGVVKRSRSVRSPSYLRHTPRWTASPSPPPPPYGAFARQITPGLTPLAYATPHSNAPLQELRPAHQRGSSVARSHVPVDYATDELFDIEIYESGSDASYRTDDDGDDGDNDDGDDDDDDDDDNDDAAAAHAPAGASVDRESPLRQLPEDEPWPGIEDQDLPSDGENVDPRHDHVAPDQRSSASSQPSEYPSTETAWPGDHRAGFHIHEDEA
ncbi:hypothetical protein UVI_02033840 [Ustilaginoidea virens]|nr:hypothetical protein UVI_02033840 [Ustilaginoidea virens]